jgi:hypothetical protein
MWPGARQLYETAWPSPRPTLEMREQRDLSQSLNKIAGVWMRFSKTNLAKYLNRHERRKQHDRQYRDHRDDGNLRAPHFAPMPLRIAIGRTVP